METTFFTAAAISCLATKHGTITHYACVVGFDHPMTIDEIRQSAMTECCDKYPIMNGWEKHNVSIAPFDPQSFANDVKQYQR